MSKVMAYDMHILTQEDAMSMETCHVSAEIAVLVENHTAMLVLLARAKATALFPV